MSVRQQIQDLTSREESYVLLQRFSMPTKDGSKDAIAVTFEVSKILLSFYTLLVGVIMLQLWYLVVLVGIARAARSPKLTRNKGVANVAIWNCQASPLAVIKAMFDYRSHIPLYALMWAAAAALAWAGSFTMSLLVTPELIIGAAAPANLKAIYVPETPSTELSSVYLRWQSLHTPSNLRAVEVLGAVDPKKGQATNTSSFNVVVQDPQTSTDSEGRDVYRIDYSYNLDGVDFGLQHVPHLGLAVIGSCVTEYGWYNSSVFDDIANVTYDTYFAYNNESSPVQVSLADGKPPVAWVVAPEDQPGGANVTFAFIISSIERRSFTPGTDPWYLTEPVVGEENGAAYRVQSQRPALSCWQQDTWTYNGQARPVLQIDELKALPPALVDVFQATLATPRIINLAQALGTSALKSAATSQGYYFDAAVSSIRADLERLVLGAYIATKNTLQETTMFSHPYDDIANLAYDSATKQFKDGAADFVLYGSGFAALRVKFLIIVPVIAFVLWLLVYLLTDNPCVVLPWAYVNALKAPVLYTAVDTETFRDDNASKWDRTSQAPHYPEKKAPASVRPAHHGRTFSWDSEQQK